MVTDDERRLTNLSLCKNRYCIIEKLHSQRGPNHCDELCKKLLSTLSTDDELKNHQILCIAH